MNTSPWQLQKNLQQTPIKGILLLNFIKKKKKRDAALQNNPVLVSLEPCVAHQ